MKKTVFIIIFFSLSLQALSTKELARCINLAGKQRMLTQKMTKEALLIRDNINKKENIKKLSLSSELFDKTLNGLYNGDKNLHLKSIDSDEVKIALKKVQTKWSKFYKNIKDIINKSSSKKTYEYIIKENNNLLKSSNNVVKAYVKLVKASSSKRANAVNLSGRERMLTQKLAKNILINNNRSKIELKDAKKEFEKILNALMNSDKKLSLNATKLPKIKKALKNAKKEFEAIKFNTKDINKLDHLLYSMDNIVKLYEKSITKEKKARKLSMIINNYMNDKNINKHIINLSGKQRMLTQKMSKDAIIINLDKSIRDDLINSYILYDRTLIGLLQGDETLNLPKCRDKNIIIALKNLQKKWEPFKQNIKNLLDTKTKNIDFIIKHNEKLLKLSNQVVQLFKLQSKNTYLEQARLNIVDLAGRERMLIQKMAKEKFLILKKIDSNKNRKNLEKTKSLFENSLKVLMQGDKKSKIIKPTNKKIKKSFLDIKNIWISLKPYYERKTLSKEEKIKLNKMSKKLLKKMDKAVKLCESVRDY